VEYRIELSEPRQDAQEIALIEQIGKPERIEIPIFSNRLEIIDNVYVGLAFSVETFNKIAADETGSPRN
jgi:hypothetical protein